MLGIFAVLVPLVGVLRKIGPLNPNDAEPLTGGRLHHHSSHCFCEVSKLLVRFVRLIRNRNIMAFHLWPWSSIWAGRNSIRAATRSSLLRSLNLRSVRAR